MKNVKVILIVHTLVSAALIGYYTLALKHRWGGQSGEAIVSKKPLDVKTIRQNPGSFRSHYLPYFIYTGGK